MDECGLCVPAGVEDSVLGPAVDLLRRRGRSRNVVLDWCRRVEPRIPADTAPSCANSEATNITM